MDPITYIDSHTGGMPTRVFLSGMPDLGNGSLQDKANRLTRLQDFCKLVLQEPRGRDAMVGVVILPSSDPKFEASILFFNNAGSLGMCGHGLIGLIETLRFIGKTGKSFLFETPAGEASGQIDENKSITVKNVASYRYQRKVELQIPNYGSLFGDIAYGGNWFFITEAQKISVKHENLRELEDYTKAILKVLSAFGITGKDGAPIDHVEIVGEPILPTANSKNFVLCPGPSYDRSPCGTGSSARLACLSADGKVAPGDDYVVESITGSTFKLRYEIASGAHENLTILPEIESRAFVVGTGNLVFDPEDPTISGYV